MAKKVFIKIDEIAAAEYFPTEQPSFGLVYPAHIDIFLKVGGKITLAYTDERFDEFMVLLGFRATQQSEHGDAGCRCLCHRNVGVLHDVPCCDNPVE